MTASAHSPLIDAHPWLIALPALVFALAVVAVLVFILLRSDA